MTNYLMVGGHAKWEVFWVVVRDGRKAIISKDFDNDLTAAIDLYYKAKRRGKKLATLRCKNVAFPPPKKYQPYTTVEKKKVRSGGKIFIKRIPIEVTPMVIVNHRGVTWCPYCREFRKFRHQSGFRFDGRYVPSPGYYCLCGVSSEEGMVRRFNPNPPRIVQRTRRVSAAKQRRARKR